MRPLPTSQRFFLADRQAARHEQQVGREREPDRGAFGIFLRRHQRTAAAVRPAQRDKDGLVRPIHPRPQNEDVETIACPRDAVADFIGALRLVAPREHRRRHNQGGAKKKKGAAHKTR
jgi:hypothetical protein